MAYQYNMLQNEDAVNYAGSHWALLPPNGKHVLALCCQLCYRLVRGRCRGPLKAQLLVEDAMRRQKKPRFFVYAERKKREHSLFLIYWQGTAWLLWMVSEILRQGEDPCSLERIQYTLVPIHGPVPVC